MVIIDTTDKGKDLKDVQELIKRMDGVAEYLTGLEKRLKNHKWCDDHRRLTNNMTDQAKQSGGEALALFQKTLNDKNSATSAVTEFEKKCPAKWGRKPQSNRLE